MSRRNRKKKINYCKLIILILLILLIIGGCFFVILKGKNFLNKEPSQDEPIKQEEVPKKEVYTANMIMVGDALIHGSVYCDATRLAGSYCLRYSDGNRYSAGNVFDFKPQIEYIKEKVNGFDIAYYNQETILGGSALGLSDYPTFNSPYEVGDAMIDAGFNLVSLATNHTVDRGKNAVLSSREYWNNQSDKAHAVGSYSSNEEKKELETKILEINNITYAMLNYTYGTNGMPVSDDYLVNVWPTDLDLNIVSSDNKYQSYKEIVKNDISALRDKVDVLIVAMHWGIEYTHEPTAYEKDMANFLASCGVDIVIGTHPHVIQPVEWIEDTLVFYSLGNFISAQYQNQGSCYNYKCMVGLMPSLTITKTVEGDKKEIVIDNIQNDLIYTYYNAYSWSEFKVIPFSDSRIKNYLSNYESIYNTYAQIINSSDERISTVSLAA